MIFSFLYPVSVLAAGATLTQLTPTGKQAGTVQVLAVGGPKASLYPKLEAAMKNPELMKSVLARTKPGEPMAYDPRFGMSEGDYQELIAAMKKPTLTANGQKKELEFASDNDYVTLKSEACSFLEKGARIDKITHSLLIPGRDPLTGKEVNVASGTPLAPALGIVWTKTTDNPLSKIEVSLQRRLALGKCVLICDITEGQPLRHEEIFVEYSCDGKVETSVSTPAPTDLASLAIAAADKKAVPASPPPSASSTSDPKDSLNLISDLAAAAAAADKSMPPPEPASASKVAAVDPLEPLCVQDFSPVGEKREIGAQLVHDKNGKMGLVFVPYPRPGSKMVDLNHLSYDDEYPAHFTFSDGGATRAFTSVDLSSGSRLNKCLDDLVKRLGGKTGQDAIFRLKTLASDILRDVPDNFRFDWDPALLTYSAPELDKAKHLSPGHAPLKTEYSNTSAPIESYLKVRRGGQVQKTVLTSLLLKKLKIPHRLRVGGDQYNGGHWWIELKDGRILDPASQQLLNPGPAPGFPGWFKFGTAFYYPYQVYPVSGD